MAPFLLPLGSVHLRAMGGRAEALEAPGAANLVPGGAPPVAAPRAPASLLLLPPPSDPLTPFHGCSRAPPGARSPRAYGSAPLYLLNRAGFKGQRPLRTVSPPFNLCLALIGLASIRDLLPRFGCRRGERSPMISMFVINDEFWCRICAGWNLRWVKQLGGL